MGALPSRLIGVLIRRKLAIAETVVIRLKICATPDWPLPFWIPQLPVLIAYLNPPEICACDTRANAEFEGAHGERRERWGKWGVPSCG